MAYCQKWVGWHGRGYELTGICLLGGIGFTVSLFIANLSFEASPVLLSQAKLGVLSGTVIAGMLGYIVLHFTLPKRILS